MSIESIKEWIDKNPEKAISMFINETKEKDVRKKDNINEINKEQTWLDDNKYPTYGCLWCGNDTGYLNDIGYGRFVCCSRPHSQSEEENSDSDDRYQIQIKWNFKKDNLDPNTCLNKVKNYIKGKLQSLHIKPHDCNTCSFHNGMKSTERWVLYGNVSVLRDM